MGRILLLISLLSMWLATAVAQTAPSPAGIICDMGMARDWCDNAMLDRVEGIWEFPEDQTRVLIRKSRASSGSYDIIVVESPDTRLVPGETIGSLRESVASTKFEMLLCRNRVDGLLADPGKCLAELAESDNSLLVRTRKLKFSLASRWFLPSFWRALRVSVKNPLDQLPRGLIRVYPLTIKRQPDYL